MKERFFLLFILTVSATVLCFETQTLSLSYDEAETFFYAHDVVHYFSTLSTSLLGQNDLALRLPFIVFHLLSVILLYKISKLFFEKTY